MEGEVVGQSGRGLAILVGVGHGDDDRQALSLADKIANLRIFPDEAGRFNLSALDVSAETLVVSQFTLYADTRRGRRPSFTDAALPEIAEPLVARFAEFLGKKGLRVARGKFGAHMLVKIENDGPVTILLEA